MNATKICLYDWAKHLRVILGPSFPFICHVYLVTKSYWFCYFISLIDIYFCEFHCYCLSLDPPHSLLHWATKWSLHLQAFFPLSLFHITTTMSSWSTDLVSLLPWIRPFDHSSLTSGSNVNWLTCLVRPYLWKFPTSLLISNNSNYIWFPEWTSLPHVFVLRHILLPVPGTSLSSLLTDYTSVSYHF